MHECRKSTSPYRQPGVQIRMKNIMSGARPGCIVNSRRLVQRCLFSCWWSPAFAACSRRTGLSVIQRLHIESPAVSCGDKHHQWVKGWRTRPAYWQVGGAEQVDNRAAAHRRGSATQSWPTRHRQPRRWRCTRASRAIPQKCAGARWRIGASSSTTITFSVVVMRAPNRTVVMVHGRRSWPANRATAPATRALASARPCQAAARHGKGVGNFDLTTAPGAQC